FKVYLPLAVEGYLSPQPSPSPSPSQNQGRILVVDDEAMVREVVGEMLQQLGYEVITVADGQEAIDYYREWGHTIDLVILDLVMPHLGGKECWQALRTLDPQVKVLLSTGYDCNTAVQDLLEKGVCGFVQKPYRLQQLAEVVEKALHEPVRQ
ncbi:MAG: response regulator, partial [Nitrospinota bacterium]